MEVRSVAALARPSFDAVFGSELNYVWNSLRRLGVRESDIEDVAHEVFVVIHRRWMSYDPSRAVRPWIFGVAMRCASDWRRLARNRREEVTESPEPPAVAPSQDDTVAKRQMEALVLRALADLEEEKRSILILHDFDEQPMGEITDAFDIPLQTGYSRLHAAREELVSAARRLNRRAP